MRRFFLQIIKPVTWFIGKVAKPLPEMHSSFLWRIMNKIEPGDILLCQAGYNLSNVFIRGKFTHAAIWCGDVIVEAIGDGVVTADLTEWIMHHDHVVILRHKNLTPEQRANAAKVAKEQLGKPYDFTFENSDEAFYCSELVRYSYETALLTRGVLGDYGNDVEPIEYYQNRDVFEVIDEC